jgi:uncharacterized protein
MKTIVITGGSDGLGKALAIELSQDNKVIILSRTQKRLEEVASTAGCEWDTCDVTKSQDVKEAFEKIVKNHGKIDVVINNAGIFQENKLVDTSYDEIYNVINTNTIGALFVAKAAVEQMTIQKRGLIINIISQGGINTRPKRAAYTASKWALTGITKSLQQEVAEDGIRVTGFYPSVIETEFLKKVGIHDLSPSISVKEAVGAIQYILSCDEHVLISELGIKHYQRQV